MKLHYLSFLLLFWVNISRVNAQFINGYAQVTAITTNTLTVANVNEVSDTFESGEEIIIMQMQGDVLSNTTNTVNFGDIVSIGSVGRYEVCTIASMIETAGVPTTLNLVKNLTYSYTLNANSRVQIVTFPQLGTPNFTTTGNMQARAWNGNVGGIVAFQVTGTLTLAHNITADGAGFRGGSRSVNYYPGGTACDGSYYITTTNHTNNGAKGEGIYRSTNIDYDYARGKIINGGGGSNALINGGGGGGGNFRAGGEGGRGWNSGAGCSPRVGGLGGLGLEAYYAGARIFMGGGGGGGQQNDSNGSNGGNGGGIVLLKATTVRTTGTCGIAISVNGNAATNGTNDGQGGGGAGGSIILEVNNWNIVGTCPLTIRANGGNGGSVNSSTHGGGGGGGQGYVGYSVTIPTTNITTNTTAGIGGCDDSACTTRAFNATGPNNAGVYGMLGTPLPMQLKSFDATLLNEVVVASWEVVAFVPIRYFEVERTADGSNWESVGRQEASSQILEYELVDTQPRMSLTYYRLKQVDTDGQIGYSNLVAVHRKLTAEQLNLYPNPTTQKITIDLPNTQPYQIKCTNILGQVVPILGKQEGNKWYLDLKNCKKGLYQIQISDGVQMVTKKMVLQ